METLCGSKCFLVTCFHYYSMAILSVSTTTILFTRSQISLPTTKSATNKRLFRPLLCSPIEQQQQQQIQGDDELAWNKSILCEPCNGRGWLVCDFCKGQKTNVKSETSRIYRRCPSCRATGCVLCQSCKVFKCVTFPNYNDGEELSF